MAGRLRDTFYGSGRGTTAADSSTYASATGYSFRGSTEAHRSVPFSDSKAPRVKKGLREDEEEVSLVALSKRRASLHTRVLQKKYGSQRTCYQNGQSLLGWRAGAEDELRVEELSPVCPNAPGIGEEGHRQSRQSIIGAPAYRGSF